MDILNYFKKSDKKTIIFKGKLRVIKEKPLIIGLIRVRNESLILSDTLEHMRSFCDFIIAYDDASTDKTYQILKKHPSVVAVIRNSKWLPNIEDRLKCETQDRLELLNLAKQFNPQWFIYMDADERIIGDIKEFIKSEESANIDAVRISLFDAYLTKTDQQPYLEGPLLNFRKYYGIERRDIIMLWRNSQDITYQGLDSREPFIPNNKMVITKFYCQHYGKSLSIQHWEETCQYYIQHFPYEPYGAKWENRIGKGIHELSDFDTPLYVWGDELFKNAQCIHPID